MHYVILFFMAPIRMLQIPLVGVLCFALLIARTSGAHLHLCLDGSEVPMSVHGTNDGPLTTFDEGVGHHHDLDLSLSGDALHKKAGTDFKPVAIVAIFAFIIFFTVAKAFTPGRGTGLLPLPNQLRLRPPLRGPPALNLR